MALVFKELRNAHLACGSSPHLYSPFSYIFNVTGRSRFTYAKLEYPFALKRCHVCTYRSRLTC